MCFRDAFQMLFFPFCFLFTVLGSGVLIWCTDYVNIVKVVYIYFQNLILLKHFHMEWTLSSNSACSDWGGGLSADRADDILYGAVRWK